MSALVATQRLEEALAIVAEVKTVDAAKELVDQATALEAYARRRAAASELHVDAYVILQSANRRLGQLCRALPKATAGRKPKDASQEIEDIVSSISKSDALDAIGLSQRQANRLEKLADYADADWEARIQTLRDRVTRNAEPDTSTSRNSGYDPDTWGTPAEYVEAARDVLGAIDLDPATNAYAQNVIRAKHFYTKDDDGLTKQWHGGVWLNPPYSYPLVEQFATKLIEEHEARRVHAAIVLVNNTTDAGWFHELMGRYPVCFTKGRIAFEYRGERINQNRQGQAFFYAGPKLPLFRRKFAAFGKVMVPA